MNKLALTLGIAAAAFCGCVQLPDTSGVRVEDSRLIIDNPRFASHLTMTHQLRLRGDIQVNIPALTSPPPQP